MVAASLSRYKVGFLTMSSSRICWSCQGLVSNTSFCPTCKAIQPLNLKLDFFQIFNLPRAFDVDKNQLEQPYQTLQMQCHPDRFATRTATERRLSLEHVTRLNQAYQTLSDPLLRGGYLLEILGHTVLDAKKPSATDPVFLMEVMEYREELESVDFASSNASDRLDQLREQAEHRVDSELLKLKNSFDDYFISPKASLLDQAAKTLDRCVYHRRFLEALDQAEETLFSQ